MSNGVTRTDYKFVTGCCVVTYLPLLKALQQFRLSSSGSLLKALSQTIPKRWQNDIGFLVALDVLLHDSRCGGSELGPNFVDVRVNRLASKPLATTEFERQPRLVDSSEALERRVFVQAEHLPKENQILVDVEQIFVVVAAERRLQRDVGPIAEPDVAALGTTTAPRLRDIARMRRSDRIHRLAVDEPKYQRVVNGHERAEVDQIRDELTLNVRPQPSLSVERLSPLVIDFLARRIPDQISDVSAALVGEAQYRVSVSECQRQGGEQRRRRFDARHHSDAARGDDVSKRGRVEKVVVDPQRVAQRRRAAIE